MKLILLELNEINFDVVRDYLNSGEKLDNFKYLIDRNLITTKAEDEYNKIEPWIQWASVHLGKNYNQHGIFRLGDIVNHSGEKQVFETIERNFAKIILDLLYCLITNGSIMFKKLSDDFFSL